MVDAAPPLSEEDREHLRHLEAALWTADTRFDRDWMDDVLAPDFIEFGSSGRMYDREQVLTNVWREINAELPLPDYQVEAITPDVAIAHYRSVVSEEGGTEHGRRTSIWVRTEQGWKLRFHQGTALPDE